MAPRTGPCLLGGYFWLAVGGAVIAMAARRCDVRRGTALGSPALLRWGGLGSALALLAFVGVTVTAVVRARRG